MKDILFEDLYTYTNKYYKDVAARSARPITKTLADIAKTSPEEFNNIKASSIPYPGEAIIESLGGAYTKLSDVNHLLMQLFDNPSTTYDDKTKEKIFLKLTKIMNAIKSLPNDLDNKEQQ